MSQRKARLIMKAGSGPSLVSGDFLAQREEGFGSGTAPSNVAGQDTLPTPPSLGSCCLSEQSRALPHSQCWLAWLPAPWPCPGREGRGRARVEAREGWRDREGLWGEGEAHELCPALPSRHQVLTSILPGAPRRLHPRECWGPGSGDRFGEWDTPLPHRAGKPLTSTADTITQGPSSLKLRRAGPSQGKCGHALPLCTKCPSAGWSPSGAFGWKLVRQAGPPPRERASGGKCPAVLPVSSSAHHRGPKDARKRELWPRWTEGLP